jgi:hypothetical protein
LNALLAHDAKNTQLQAVKHRALPAAASSTTCHLAAWVETLAAAQTGQASAALTASLAGQVSCWRLLHIECTLRWGLADSAATTVACMIVAMLVLLLLRMLLVAQLLLLHG